MKKVVSLAVASLLAVALTAPAWAHCGIQHTADNEQSTTATKTGG
jgi:hypothetical protein